MRALGRHAERQGGHALRWVAGAGAAVIAAAITLATVPAHASSTTVKAQLSLTGVATKDNPTGGSAFGIHPGDTVDFLAAGAPTAGLDALGLGDLSGLVDTLLSGVANFQVTADFSKLPGGKAGTKLSGKHDVSITFPKAGNYSFTWSAQAVSLLGSVPINLNGNELAQAGVKLNASNKYVGVVKVSDHPGGGGISIQLPGVSVAPSVPVLGQLPTVGVPGANLPTLANPVGGLTGLPLPGNGSSGNGGGSHHKHGNGGSSYTYKPPGLTIPQLVVPHPHAGAGGADVTYTAPAGNPVPVAAGGNGGSGSGTGSSGPAAAKSPSPQTTRPAHTVDLAASKPLGGAQLPVLLTVLAIVALTIVTAAYGRMYLVKHRR